MKARRYIPLFLFFAGMALTVYVSLPYTRAALALFHQADRVDAALYVFEFGAIGAKLIALALPWWYQRLNLLMVALLSVVTAANYAHGFDTSRVAHNSTLAAFVQDPIGGPVAALLAAAIFPVLTYIFVSAFVHHAAREWGVEFSQKHVNLRNELATIREEHAKTRDELTIVRDEAAALREQLATERSRPVLSIDTAATLFIEAGAPESTVRGWKTRLLKEPS